MIAKELLNRIAAKTAGTLYGLAATQFRDDEEKAGKVLHEMSEQLHHKSMRDLLGEELVSAVKSYCADHMPHTMLKRGDMFISSMVMDSYSGLGRGTLLQGRPERFRSFDGMVEVVEEELVQAGMNKYKLSFHKVDHLTVFVPAQKITLGKS